MKAEKILDELTLLARSLGYTVRRESGAFRGGSCVLHEQRLIVVNRSMPAEAACVIVARGLSRLDFDHEYMKPAVQALLQRERDWAETHPEVRINVNGHEAAAE